MADRREHVPTDETRAKVDALAAFGIPQKKIAKYVGICEITLLKYYGDQIEIASVDRIVKVANALYLKAVEGNVVAQMFYLKTRGGWRETDRTEVTKDESINRIQIEVINANGELKNDK